MNKRIKKKLYKRWGFKRYDNPNLINITLAIALKKSYGSLINLPEESCSRNFYQLTI